MSHTLEVVLGICAIMTVLSLLSISFRLREIGNYLYFLAVTMDNFSDNYKDSRY